MYSGRIYDAFPWNEHLLFTAERVSVLLVAAGATQLAFPQLGVVVLAWGLLFSLVHNNFYYLSRHLQDPAQPYSLTYSSSTSSAKLELGFKARLLLGLVGLASLGLLWLV